LRDRSGRKKEKEKERKRKKKERLISKRDHTGSIALTEICREYNSRASNLVNIPDARKPNRET
jgi:hypothetical protein